MTVQSKSKFGGLLSKAGLDRSLQFLKQASFDLLDLVSNGILGIITQKKFISVFFQGKRIYL